jgi:fructose-bisphosphate aldolase, class I
MTLEETVQFLMSGRKGILAADERPSSIGKRFEAVGIASTAESRRAYREMLFTTPELGRFLSGAILFDETLRQNDAQGVPLGQVLARVGILPGIKVDEGATALAACPGELVTEGLDGLRARLREYSTLGARFAKWRAVIRIGDHLPSDTCLGVNAHALARYAALCQEERLVPIVEPEVLMEGAHSLQRAEVVTSRVLAEVFAALRAQRVSLEEMLLKPNMVLPGRDVARAAVDEVAVATVRALLRNVPAAVGGVVFLSGGQSEREATQHLNAICASRRPWPVSFSFGRALQDSALKAWGGRDVAAGQRALHHRARLNSAASLGSYFDVMESEAASEITIH